MTQARRVPPLWFLLLGWIAANGTASAQTPPCRATAHIEPEVAVVGQQVTWWVEIETHSSVTDVAWVAPPSFPHVRTEVLPGRPGRPGTRAAFRMGRRFSIREERRALFAERTGNLRLESPGLLCRIGRRQIPVAIPTRTLVVEDPPVNDRPSDFAGVVGPLVAQVHVEPPVVTLGDSVEITVSIRGRGNLWDIPDPIDELLSRESSAPDVFAEPRTLDFRRGTRLMVQLLHRYQVVPRSVGSIEVGSLHLRYFEPESGDYAVSSTSTKTIEVRAAVDPEASVRSDPRNARDQSTLPTRFSTFWPWLIAVSTAVAIAFWVQFRGTRRAQATDWRDRTRTALASAAEQERDGHADRAAQELTRALRFALAPDTGSDAGEAGDWLAGFADGPIRDAIATLIDLERSRFDPAASIPGRDRVVANIDALPRPARR